MSDQILETKKKNIENVKFELTKHNINLLKTSCYYESFSWPNPKNPKFLNIVIEISTKLTPIKLLNKCKEIELYLGRKKAKKNSPRKCDIDILDYNNKKLKGKIILPHPRMHKRNFVLLPLFELNKDWKHPVLKHHIKKLIFSLPNVDIRSINQI